jgi:hypothetical protein
MPNYTREDQVDIRVTLDGVAYGNSWDSIAGGDKDSNTVKIRVNGKEIDIGGPATRGDLTVGIQLSDQVAAWIRTFDTRCGKGALKVSASLLDADLNVIWGPFTRTGTVKGTTGIPDMDKANSSPGPAKFQFVMSCNEDAA